MSNLNIRESSRNSIINWQPITVKNCTYNPFIAPPDCKCNSIIVPNTGTNESAGWRDAALKVFGIDDAQCKRKMLG